MTSSRSQVEAAGGASGTKQPAVADTASRDAARLAPVPHALVLSSVALFLILLAGTAALSVQAYVLPERATSTTSAVAEASNELLIGLLNAETGQRGYLLTNRLIYLQPYDKARSTVSADQQRLGSKVSAVPGGRQYFVKLSNLVAAKMAELATTISLSLAGDHARALRIVDTNEGKQVMDQARTVIADLQRAAAAAGASRRSDLHSQLTVFAGLAAVLAVVDAGGLLFLRRRLSTARKQAADEICKKNAELEEMAQQADGQRRTAMAEAAGAGEAARVARDTEQRLFQFLDAMPVAVFIHDASGQPYYANHDAEGMLGRSAVPNVEAGELAETYGAFVAGTDQLYPTERLPVVLALLGESSHIGDMEIHHPGGQVIPLEVWGRPMYGASGEVDYGLAVFVDMSERNATERTIADQAALLELAHDAILVRDQDSRIVYWNAGAEHTYGFTRAEAVGRISHEILHTTFPEPVADIEAAVIQDARWEGELINRCADGRPIVVESRWVGERGPDGSLQRFMEINRDITARKDAERQLHRGAEEIRALNATLERQVQQRTVHLQRANNNLAAFTYTIAHDLSTPLRALSGYAEVLVEEYRDRLDDAGIGYAGRIQAASAHMATLIDSLLLLSRVSQAEMNLQEVDLSAEVTAICDQLRAHDPDRRVRVTVEEGVRITADRGLILIVLENLLQNAWKFTAHRDDATIEFATTSITSTADASICCYVRDNGVGFDFAYADKLFQPFQRLHSVSEFPGAGVGLATVQRIIERHGGRTWAEGAVGRGATFYFTLDVKGDGS